MIYPGFESLNPGSWRPIPGDGKHVERPGQTKVKVWTWDGFKAIETEGVLFERCQRMPDPDPAMRAQRGFYAQQCEKARNTPDLTKEKHYVFSVPDDSMGWQNPHRDYFINSPTPGSLYKWSKWELIEAVAEITHREYKRVAPEYERLKSMLERLTGLLAEPARSQSGTSPEATQPGASESAANVHKDSEKGLTEDV